MLIDISVFHFWKLASKKSASSVKIFWNIAWLASTFFRFVIHLTSLILLVLFFLYRTLIKWCMNSCKLVISDSIFFKKNFIASFYGWGSTVTRLQGHCKEIVYFLPLHPQEFLVFSRSTIKKFQLNGSCQPSANLVLGKVSNPLSNPFFVSEFKALKILFTR